MGKIGIFDSGYGGFTILKAFLNSKKLSTYDYVYLGDNARAPYGNKSKKVIYKYTKQALDFLFKQGCELIIIACNTASAKALRKIQQEYLPEKYPEKKVLGVVIPIIEDITESKAQKVGIIGTRATIESHIYKKELEERGINKKIFEQAAPLLVPLVEESWIGRPETNKILKKYLRPLKNKKINILVLACTHYPFLIKDIKRIIGKNCQVLNTPEIVMRKLEDYLKRHSEIENQLDKNKKIIFYTSDNIDYFKEFYKKFLGKNIKPIPLFSYCDLTVDN